MEKETYPCEMCKGNVPKDKFMAIDFRDSSNQIQSIMICEICAEAFVAFFDKLKFNLDTLPEEDHVLVGIEFDLKFGKPLKNN